MKRAWRIWAKTMGDKVGDDREADIAAIIRTFWWIAHIVTCGFIIVNNGHNLGLW